MSRLAVARKAIASQFNDDENQKVSEPKRWVS
jgi:hypothetical protein